MEFPNACLRGLKKPDWYDPETGVSREAFAPLEKKPREDGGCECSINWEDDPGAVALVEHKTYGVVRVLTANLLALIEAKSLKLIERAREKKNPYHGNIVFHGAKYNRKHFAGQIAMNAIPVEGTLPPGVAYPPTP